MKMQVGQVRAWTGGWVQGMGGIGRDWGGVVVGDIVGEGEGGMSMVVVTVVEDSSCGVCVWLGFLGCLEEDVWRL